MYRPKHVEWTCREINSLHIVASVGHSIETEFSFMFGATFRIELQQSQWKEIKHAKRRVKQWKHLTGLTDKCEYSETKTCRGEMQWGKLSRQTLVHETVHNLFKSQSSEAKDKVYRNESVCTWPMRTRRSTAPYSGFFSTWKEVTGPGGLVRIKGELGQSNNTSTFQSSSFFKVLPIFQEPCYSKITCD